MAYSPSASTYGKYIDLQNYNTPGAAPENSGAMWMSGTDASPKLYTNIGADFGGDISGDSVTVDGAGTFGSLVIGGASLSSTELESIDGDTAATATTLVAADRFVVNDNGTMVQVALSDLETFMESSLDTMGSQFTSATGLAAVGTIGTGVWQGTAVARAYIAADAIDGTKLADDAVNSEHIALGALDAEHYASGSIEGGHIAADALDSQHYAAGSIDNEHMAANSVDSDQYVDASIDTAHLGDNQVTLAKMAGLARGKFIYGDASGDPAALAAGANGKILVADANGDPSWTTLSGDATLSAGALTIAADAVEPSMINILDDSLAATTTHFLIADGTDYSSFALSGDVTCTNAGVVTIGNDKIDSQHYAAASIDNEHLADDAVDSDEIAAGAIDLAHMSDNSVDSDQYVDGSIDLAHMSANSVDSDQYVNGSVDNVHLANSTTTVGSTSCALGSTTTAFAGLTGLNFTAANASIAASIGANTLTLGGDTSTVAVAGGLDVTDGIDCAEGLLVTTGGVEIQAGGLDVVGNIAVNGDLTLESTHDAKARSFITYSDSRLKTNVKTVTNAMDMIQGLRGVSYDLKTGGKREFGFIAQEVNTVVPEVVSTKNNMMGIDYTRITSLLVEAVKTQQAQIEDLKAKLDK